MKDQSEDALAQLNDLETTVKTHAGTISNYTITVYKHRWYKSEELRSAVDQLVADWGFKLDPLV